MAKLWFSLYDNNAYNGVEEGFVPAKTISGIKHVEENYQAIYAELTKYLISASFESQFNATMVEVPKKWMVRSLRVWGVEMYDIQKHFPVTMNLLNKIPNVINIGFNLLEPDSKINGHHGDTNANYRCHLGLKIPANTTECVMKVNGLEKNWKEGEVICFVDACYHEAWNNSKEQRIILLFDVLRPEYVTKKNKICSTVLVSFYIQRIGNIWRGIYNIPRHRNRYILFPFILLMQIMIPIRNKLKKLF